MKAYAMSYRNAAGRRVVQHLLASSAAAAWEQAFDIAERLPGVRGFAVALDNGGAA